MAMGVYGCLCVSHSIDSASIPQQPCDPSEMLLIVTRVGLRAFCRGKTMGGGVGSLGQFV